MFENVTVVGKANIYFEGRVSSRTILMPDGTRKTLGIMLPGEYEFATAQAEHMEFLAGELSVLLPGEPDWRSLSAGDSFEIGADSSFKIQVRETADYICSYL